MVYYPKAMHLQQAFADQHLYQACPVTERLCKTVLSLPMHPYLSDEEIQMVSEKVIAFLNR